LHHAGIELGAKIEIKWLDSEILSDFYIAERMFSDCNGILIPGGFGPRGIEGKINAARFARERNIPYLGICLGMQIAAIEFARNVIKFSDANSSEFCPKSKNLVIDLMKNQCGVLQKGGTMRLGAYPCKIKNNSLLHAIYNKNEIFERHRHRYEFNNNFRSKFIENGMIISGTSPDDLLVEAIELKNNIFFIGVQFHPEFKSRPNKPHPLFLSFVKNSLQNQC
jgi:CTP synthase